LTGSEAAVIDDLRTPLANTFTLGVGDLPREREFYRGLGWRTAFDGDDFVVFELQGSLLALFPFDKLARDGQASPEPGRGGIRFSIIINVDTPGDVDRVIDAARRAGGAIAKEPGDAVFFDGRNAYFADPEGNYWEVTWAAHDNPVSAAARRAAGLPT
jgi:hypothetical protein